MSERPFQPRLLVVAGLVWLAPDRLLVQRRGPNAAHGPGCLELPGGKVEPGEAPIAALVRELTEEWGPHAQALTPVAVAEVLHHIYPPPGPEVVLVVYHVDATAWGAHSGAAAWSTLVTPTAGASVSAWACADLPVDAFLAADRPYIAKVRAGLVRLPSP